ncbi:hypothetical protein ACFOYW_10415 [Gryllotalpicola reticulitermitis]|uniref:Uncharacterized protein n=1 Tax=Gryllotalpicola reticulitermitis TaxID=1184153 RepID=A0ABV8Q9C9_9MICO
MPGGQRGRARRGAAYWLSLLIGCLTIVVIGGLIYFHFSPQEFARVVPTPTYSKGPGGLYNPGVTLVPNPPVTPTP